MTAMSRARAIMAGRMIAPNESEKYLGTHAEGPAMFDIAPEVLRDCARTHVLVAGASVSIMDLQQRLRDHGLTIGGTGRPWYVNEPFAHDKPEPRWYLVPLAHPSPCVGSPACAGNADAAFRLGDRVRTPMACELAHALALTWLVLGLPLYERTYVGCQELVLGYQVSCGLMDRRPIGWTLDITRRSYR